MAAPGTWLKTARFKDLALDANDHQALADWWVVPGDGLRPPGLDPEGNEFCVFTPR